MPRKKKPASPKLSTPIEAVKHKDKRANIPTEELRDFIAEDEKKPKTILYPRDPSLDPQLVWKGKDEQDRQPLAVPAVPIYIQEHIKPQAIIDLVRSTPLSRGRGVGGEVEFQPSLFADFNGLSFEERVDFYHHEQNWTNRMILGDSLLVMTSLAEKEGLKGKVQMIYFDPPYGIKFGSNWQVSTRKRDVKDGKAEDATRQPEQVKAFRDTWQLGIHSYLSYLRDRLVVARELLAESGSIFVQIGDENVHLVRCVLDEVFGSENFVSMIAYKTTSGVAQALAPRRICDYIIWYAKVRESLKFRRLYIQSSLDLDFFNRVEEVSGHRRPITIEEINNRYSIPTGARQFYSLPLHSRGAGDNVPRMYNSRKWAIPADRHWSHTQEGFQRLTLANRIVEEKTVIRSVVYWDDFPYVELSAYWDDTGPEMDKYYAVQTSTKPIERCMLMCTDPGDLVLDPTCGSGTTAYVAEQWGRRWITIDTSRVAIALARTRLMSGRFPYYLLADSPEGRRKEAEVSGQFSVTSDQSADDRSPMTDHSDIKRGFVYERVPHVTLKSIANNEEIDEIHAKYQPELERLRAEINKAAKQKWEEWEIPTPSPALPHLQKPQIGEGERALLEEYWQVRRARQKEIDASIARHADIEFLYDKPYEDKKRIRVAGPFTVESLSPHRVLAPDDPATAFREDALNTQDFVQMILENLKASGVQNTIKNQRLKFDSLEPYAGTWIHAVGTYTERLPSPSGRGAGGEGKLPSPSGRGAGGEGKLPSPSGRGAGGEGKLPSPSGRGAGGEGKPPSPSGEGPGVRSRRAAISIGPELGTVSAEQIKEAAKEAVRGVGFDLLIVCGFAFDPHVSEEAKRYGSLTVLPARMNPDLAMGDELLKKTGAGNLFMVFGEPDIEIKKKDGKYIIRLNGLDVYDPTTGEIRSNSIDDIACWFIDTDYNEETFIVRHAYFTGADEPYDKLKRALRAEIDESAWSALYRTESIPFEKPSKKGKIAVKVINHYGDEVLKVFEIG